MTTLYRVLVLNSTEKLLLYCDLLLLEPRHRKRFLRLADHWWSDCRGDAQCRLGDICTHHLSLAMYCDLGDFDYAVRWLNRSAITALTGPIYTLADHFSTTIKKSKLRKPGVE